MKVVLRVETTGPEDLLVRIAAWLQDWWARNQRWKWFGEQVMYSDEFASPPTGLQQCGTGKVCFRLECQPTARWWKDWLVIGLIGEMRGAFSEVSAVDRICDCDG